MRRDESRRGSLRGRATSEVGANFRVNSSARKHWSKTPAQKIFFQPQQEFNTVATDGRGSAAASALRA
jgi:hypothetical protein